MKPHQVRPESKRAAKSKQEQNRSTHVESQRQPEAYQILTEHALASLPRRVSDRKRVLGALYFMMTPAHPDHADVSKEYHDLQTVTGLARELSAVAMELEATRNEAAALFHFMMADAERQRYLADKGLVGVQASSEAVCGILALSDRVEMKLQACYQNASSIAGALKANGGVR